ncbi:hypothetical protein CYLTODRAFT_486186, partial [Cylindrobasidium torrendii FP15055 ss-10]
MTRTSIKKRGLVSLPNELILEVARSCSPRTLANLAATSKHLKPLVLSVLYKDVVFRSTDLAVYKAFAKVMREEITLCDTVKTVNVFCFTDEPPIAIRNALVGEHYFTNPLANVGVLMRNVHTFNVYFNKRASTMQHLLHARFPKLRSSALVSLDGDLGGQKIAAFLEGHRRTLESFSLQALSLSEYALGSAMGFPGLLVIGAQTVQLGPYFTLTMTLPRLTCLSAPHDYCRLIVPRAENVEEVQAHFRKEVRQEELVELLVVLRTAPKLRKFSCISHTDVEAMMSAIASNLPHIQELAIEHGSPRICANLAQLKAMTKLEKLTVNASAEWLVEKHSLVEDMQGQIPGLFGVIRSLREVDFYGATWAKDKDVWKELL